jgi:hypothetical protein
MSTETPLNARRDTTLFKANLRWPVKAKGAGSDEVLTTIKAICDFADDCSKGVLAEAERALRERVRGVEKACECEGCCGWRGAADLLAGMRR